MQIRSKFFRSITTLSSLGMNAFIFGCFVTIGLFYVYSRDLPDPNKLAKYEPPIVTRLYANDGKLLAEYATEHRLYLPLDAIPRRVIDAFLAAEDKGFFQHDGVDFMSIARAIVTNIANYGEGRAMVGGSTITQQVVKNFLLTNERSFERKIKEAILAFRMDRIYSKDRILELYLNEIYLGLSSYGVAAAALNYFNKSLEELSIAESAFLAGLPKGPANYDPRRNYDRAMRRRAYVLNRMYVNGYISKEEVELANASPIVLRERDRTEVVDADFFSEEVRRQLAQSYGSDVLYKGGLFVKTTLSPDMQEVADHALRKTLVAYDRRHGWRGPISHLPNFSEWRKRMSELQEKTPLFDSQTLGLVKELSHSKAVVQFLDREDGVLPLAQAKWARRYISDTEKGRAVSQLDQVLQVGDVILVEPVDAEVEPKSDAKRKYRLLQIPKVNGALVAMDPHSGRVLAMSGGYSYQGSEFNRATQARRQPGSAFKPFVYLAGIESGMTPATLLMDAPISIPQGPDKPDWTPQNYSKDYLGAIPMRMALEKSRNASTVYLASLLGMSRIQEIGQRFGIYDKLPPHYATVLGSQETTLLRLVNAYSMLVNGGKRVQPKLIERIDDRYGTIVYRRDDRPCENCVYREDIPPEVQKAPPELPDNREVVVDAASAFQMTYMLQGVVERGTAVRANKLGIPLGGKTGTTNDSRDAWFVGFSPDLVVGLYIGFDRPRPLGPKETGSSVALPGFVDFVDEAVEKASARPFSMPEGIRLYKINRYTGQPPYYGAGNQNVIYEAFKYYEDPRYAYGYGTRFTAHNPDSEIADAEGIEPGITSQTNQHVYEPSSQRYDYSTQQVTIEPSPSASQTPPPVRHAPQSYTQPVPSYQTEVVPVPQEVAPEYNQMPTLSYAERARQLQKERLQRQNYYQQRQNYGGSSYYGRGGRYMQRTAPPSPKENPQINNYGTGGLY